MAKLSSTDIYGDLYVDGNISEKGTSLAEKYAALSHTHNYAASGHSHGLINSNMTVTMSNTTTDDGWSMINSSYQGFLLKSIRTNASAPNWICNNYAAGVAFGGEDTKGVLSCAYNAPSIKIAGGNSTKPVWWVGLTGTSGTTYDLNRINTAYNHSQAAHAPSNAQKNSDITKAEIEAKLTGNITSHTHSAYAAASHGTHLTLGTGSGNAYRGDYGNTAYTHSQAAHAPTNAQKNSDITKAEIEAKLTGAITSHSHNAIASRGNVTCESGITARPAVSGLSMTQAYDNGYPATYGNVINLRGTGDGQLFIGWSGTDGAHAPVYVRSKRDNVTSANWSPWAQVYTSANPQTSINGYTLWVGTQAQYDAISSKSSTTIYYIKS